MRARRAFVRNRRRRRERNGRGVAREGVRHRRAVRVRRRLEQLRAAMLRRSGSGDVAWARRALPPAELALWERMPPYDRAHAIRVARAVATDPPPDELLIRAALLHDCGKTLPPHRVPLLWRGVVVLLRAAHPRLLALLARPWGPLWPVYLHSHHPTLGARELERAGSPSALAELVRRHQDLAPADPALRRLQAADDAC